MKLVKLPSKFGLPSKLINMASASNQTSNNNDPHSIYQFTAKNAEGREIGLDKYKGKVLIVVNVASQCGYTESNYTQLKELLEAYHDRGLEIAAFPCNQFGRQEPGCELDIVNFIHDKYKFEPDIYSKIDVNGANTHPIYKFLKKEKGGTVIDAIKWNFTKFLIDRNGHVVERYAPATAPKEIIPSIEKALSEAERKST